jgi:hypothetical protein
MKVRFKIIQKDPVKKESALKMKAADSFDTIIPTYQTERHHIPEDRNIDNNGDFIIVHHKFHIPPHM